MQKDDIWFTNVKIKYESETILNLFCSKLYCKGLGQNLRLGEWMNKGKTRAHGSPVLNSNNIGEGVQKGKFIKATC